MKTFTNCAEKKAKQFLNLLQGYTKGIRMTAILILLLMGVSNAWAATFSGGEILVLKPNSNWTKDGARFAAYFFGNGEKWVSMTAVSINGTSGYYQVTAPSGGYKNVIFCRMNGGNQTNNWDNKWNQTGDLTYDGTKNVFTVPSGAWDGSTSSWGNITIAVTLDAQSGTGGTTSVDVNYGEDERPTVTAPTRTGYTFGGFYTSTGGSGSQVINSSNAWQKNISNYVDANGRWIKNAACTLYAKWTEKTYSVTISAGAGGTVSPSGSQTVGQVTAKTVTATPNDANYEFVNWTSTGGVVVANTSSASTTITATAAGTLTANFRSTATNSLAVVAGAGIESVAGSADPVTLGSTYNIEATPKTGYTFSTWTANPAANATFGSATTANTTVTVKNGSVTVTASATEIMSTLTTSNQYDAGDPGYAVPTASVNSIGYETTATVTATAAGNGYTFTGWTLTNCTRTDGGAADATNITVRSNGDSKAAEVVANYAEDLTSTYYVQGDNAGPFSEGWNANQNTMMKKHSGNANSNDVYWEIDVPQSKVTPNDNQWEFKIYNAAGSDDNKKWLGWGSGDAHYWLTKENNSLTLSTSGSNNIRFKPYLAGKYTFHLNYDDSSKPTLEVTWPVYNQLRISAANPADATNTGEFDMTGSGTYTVTRSLNANTTYTFKIVYDSEWYGASSGNLTRASSSKTLSTSSDNLTLKTDVAGNYTFTFNSSDKNLSVTYPEAYKVTFSKGTGGKTVTAKVDGVAITSGDYVLKGKSVVFTQEANTGYTFSKWTDGSGNQLSTDPSYTCTVNADVTVKAVFVENKASIDIKSSDDNKGTVSPTSAYVGVATKVEVTATPVDGYYTQTWTATAPAVSSATTGNTTTLSGNGTIGDGLLVATFSERYQLISKHATNTLPGNNPYFTKQGDGSWACIVTLAANTEYSFKVKDYANNSAEYGNSVSALQSCADWVKIWKDANSAIKFKSTQAGSYTIHIRWSGADGISLTAPQVKITYPDLPTTPAVTYTAVRVYKEQTINEWIAAGDGAQATPYQLYNDETVRLTVTPLTEVAGLTAYYKVGETEQTANTFDLTTITTEVTPITITTYYKDSYGKKGPEATTTVYFQQVLTPQLLLVTDPVKEISLEKVQAGTKVELTYSATYNGYTGSVTIKENDSILATTSDTKKVIYPTPTDIGILTFTATTEEVAGRVFETSTEVAVYKLVTIKVNDPQGLMNKVYLWRDANDAEDADIKTEWPGESFLQNFGTWHIFTVKYPYYTRFIVNDSKNFVQENGKQTENYDIPDHDACYELSSNTNGNRKYELTAANCPGDLAVGDIADITITQGENKIVAPSVQVSLGNKLSDVTATVSSADETIATAIMSGTNIIVYGHKVDRTTITVKYTLREETVTKTFQVTVEKDTHITIQVKVPIGGSGTPYDNIGWNDNSNIKIHYWWSNGTSHDITLEYVYEETNKYKYLQAELPLHTDGKTNFLVYYEYLNDEVWRKSKDVTDVSTDGCYTMKNAGYGNQPSISRSGDYCWEAADEYQVKIVMQNGKEYSSNIVTSTSDILSFFAPGKDEVNYRSGVVMLYKNGNLHTTIAPATFSESNVYTAQVNDDGTGLTNVAVYTGNYYVRTYGNNDWGQRYYQEWTDDQRSQRKFTYFMPREGEFYNHYWIETLEYYDAGKDVSGWVANRYNNDLAGKLQNDKITDNNGKIHFGSEQTANVRFGYDPRTNYFGRAILKGSGENQDFLNVHCDNAFSDAACQTALPYGTSGTANKFTDVSNWVYQKEFYVKIDNNSPSAKLYIDATAYNSSKSHLLGYKTNEITGEEDENQPNERTIVGAGTSNGIYHMLVVYDFKTNRIITTWSIVGNIEINDPIIVNSDLLIIRHENDPAPQVNLNDDGKISSIDKLYFAMELERGDADHNKRHEEQYFFSLPFNCLVGSISGVPGYMEIWGLQRYRGDLRAKNGLYLESPTYWEWMKETDTIKAGEGYALVFDKKNATWNEFDGQSILRLYFPSMSEGFDLEQLAGDALIREYPSQRCTLQLHDRYLHDSNWKMIGTMSYNNSTVTQSSDQGGYTPTTTYPSFRYKYGYTMGNDNKTFSYTYTAENGGTDAVYNSFHGYMVQFEGKITWSPINETVPEQIAARRNAAATERTNITIRIEIANTEGVKQDQTFVALDEKGTTTFDQNLDLNKIINSGQTNIYTLSENVPFAGNTLPMGEALVPVGVQIATEGEYTFRMPDGTEGMVVELIDYEAGTTTNMLLSDYTVTLSKGTHENRFALHVQPEKQVGTGVGNVGDEAKGDKVKGIEKYLIDGKLIIRTAEGAVYDAQGHVVQQALWDARWAIG